MQDALNGQINAELWSAYLYLSMSMDAENKGMKGTAHWFYVQWMEEQDHAHILMNYLNACDAKVELKPIAKVDTAWKSPVDMYKDAYAHEQKVTEMFHNLAVLANEEKDFATANRLVWFVDEQVEEEQECRDIIAAFEMVAGDKAGTYMLDGHLGARSYKKASPLE